MNRHVVDRPPSCSEAAEIGKLEMGKGVLTGDHRLRGAAEWGCSGHDSNSDASLDTCLEIIRLMDGFMRSQVTIRYMENLIMIGGGSHEFIITVETGAAIHNLLGPLEDEDEFVEITVGGQACEFPQKYIVSLELIESASCN